MGIFTVKLAKLYYFSLLMKSSFNIYNVYISEVRNIYDMNLLHQYKLEIQIQDSNEQVYIVEKKHNHTDIGKYYIY